MKCLRSLLGLLSGSAPKTSEFGDKRASISDADPEILIGIDPSWSPIEKKAFLQKEFNKWNGRLNNLRDDGDGDDDGGGTGGAGAGSARYQAPSVLDAIGQHPATDKKKIAP